MKTLQKLHIASFALCLVSLISVTAQAQTSRVNDFLTLRSKSFLLNENDATQASIVSTLSSHIDKLQTIKARRSGDTPFLQTLFYRTHRKFLKHYDPSATFGEMMTTGSYGCVPGTALYAIILDYFGYDYQVREYTNHVYLEVSKDSKIYRFESTDPLMGFSLVDNPDQDLEQQFVDGSRTNKSLSSIGADAETRVSSLVNSNISLKQLAGLQYYNLSIYDYYEEDYITALSMAAQAVELYNSNRTESMMQFVISTILRSKKISGKEKQKYLRQYVSQVQQKRLSQTLK